MPVVAHVPTRSSKESKQGASRGIRSAAKKEVLGGVEQDRGQSAGPVGVLGHKQLCARVHRVGGCGGKMQCKRGTSVASAQVQPNPSVNARPNIKTPGPRGGAGLSSTARAWGFAAGLRVTSNVRRRKNP
jgi:hypothetical protein